MRFCPLQERLKQTAGLLPSSHNRMECLGGPPALPCWRGKVIQKAEPALPGLEPALVSASSRFPLRALPSFFLSGSLIARSHLPAFSFSMACMQHGFYLFMYLFSKIACFLQLECEVY